ncbi:transposable element Tcb2 transposase [Trichonephila clavipes]|nr:transposable element Tcb2 transposase [Trichonephila clavipes]
MSPIEHEWDIVGRRIARDLRPVASTDELWLRIQTIWNTLPQTDIKNVFNSMPRRVLDESRSFFRVHTGYFSNIPKCIKAEFIASWGCSQSSVVSSSQR